MHNNTIQYYRLCVSLSEGVYLGPSVYLYVFGCCNHENRKLYAKNEKLILMCYSMYDRVIKEASEQKGILVGE